MRALFGAGVILFAATGWIALPADCAIPGGARHEAPASLLANAERKMLVAYGARLNTIEYKTVLHKSGRYYPLFIVAVSDSPCPENGDTCSCRHIESVVFKEEKMNRIRSVHLGIPCVSPDESVEREPIRQYPLSKLNELPTTIAQLSLIDNRMRFDFEVFDSINITAPYCDSTVCAFPDDPTSPTFIFVPNNLNIPDAPCGLSDFRGDGVTLVEGIESTGERKDNLGRWIKYATRPVRLIWDRGKAKKKYGNRIPEK